jgi:hypothetical protein
MNVVQRAARKINGYTSKSRPTRVYSFRYERADGEFRTISVPVGYGRFKVGSEAEAKEIAERRLSEQFGEMCFTLEARRQEVEPNFVCPGAELLRGTTDLHQNFYALVAVEKQ